MTSLSVDTRLALLRQNVALLAQIPQDSEEEFKSSFLHVHAALHLMQVSVQVLIDLAGYVVARRGVGPATSSLGLIETLETAGYLPEHTVARFRPVIGFRNRVVHLYDQVDASILYAVLRDQRTELLELADLLLEALPEGE